MLKRTAALLAALSSWGCVPVLISESLRNSSEASLVAVLQEAGAIDADHAGVTGMLLDQDGVVTTVIACSPADQAGITKGDRVSFVDGMAALAGRIGTELELTVTRDGVPRTVSIRRAEWRSVFNGDACQPLQTRQPG